MSEVDALFRSLRAAPPRSMQIVVKAFVDQTELPVLCAAFGLEPEQMNRLIARSLNDVSQGAQLSYEEELTRDFAALREALSRNRVELRARLDGAAKAWAESPDRDRDELVRRVLIAVVIVLSGFFYWREQNKPQKWERRPTPVTQPSK